MMTRVLLSRVRLALGVVMLLLGAFLLLRVFVLGMPALTGTRLGDAIFGVFFVVRGAMNLKLRAIAAR